MIIIFKLSKSFECFSRITKKIETHIIEVVNIDFSDTFNNKWGTRPLLNREQGRTQYNGYTFIFHLSKSNSIQNKSIFQQIMDTRDRQFTIIEPVT